jgi:hypothetical protein
MVVNTYQQISIQIEFIKFNLANYINGSSKNINLDNIESHINMYTIQFNNLMTKQNEALIKNDSNTFIC